MKIEIEVPDDLNVSPDMEIFHCGQEGLTTPKYHIARCIMMTYWFDGNWKIDILWKFPMNSLQI